MNHIIKLFKRLARMYEVGAWLDASAKRQDWQDQASGWIPPMDNNF